MDNLGTWLKKEWAYVQTMWSYLGFALREDKADAIKMADGTHPGMVAGKNMDNFWRIYKYPLIGAVVLIAVIFFIISLFKARHRPQYKDGRSSHHGINKYGERY